MIQHAFHYDPTYGYDLEALKRVPSPEPPADFETFWRNTYQQALAVPPKPTLRKVDTTRGLDVYEIEFDAWGGLRLGGWLTVPADGADALRRGVVCGHGYGGRQSPDLHVPGPPAVCLFPCARGFDRSAKADLPSTAARHVLHGIKSRESYLHRGCVADLWAAATALLELYPQAAEQLDYIGASFGGGIGALALPWDARFHRAALRHPSFGNHPLRVTLPCNGSGEAVRTYIRHHDEKQVLRVLAYHDAATAARYIEQPTLCQCALFDPAVPPPGQFAVHNALPGQKQLLVCQAGHFEYPDEAKEAQQFHDHAAAWFTL